MKILFIGCVESSYILLKTLLDNGKNVVGVVTKKESAINADFADLLPLCEKYNVDYILVKNVNDFATEQFIRDKAPDLIYCFGWSQIIKKNILDIPKVGTVGFHPAELPNNRGRHPIIWALALGLQKTASTFFMINEGADTGDIISQEIVGILYEDDAQSLYDKIMYVAEKQILSFTEAFEQNQIHAVKQRDCGNEWRKRGIADGKIDWRMSATAIYNLVRALTKPYVGAHFLHGEDEIKIWKVEVLETGDYSNIEPGKVLKVNSETDYLIKAYDGIVHILDSDRVVLEEGEYLF